MKKLTVSKEWLLHYADSIERDAKESLNAWILLGQSEKYGQAMNRARKIRHAATLPIRSRREYLELERLEPHHAIADMRQNPANRRKPNAIARAAQKAKSFLGREPSEIIAVHMPKIPDAVACIGQVSVIQYVAERDGKVYEFRHAFKQGSRPHLCVTPDGKLVLMIGGSWVFTKDGFVDR